MAALRDFPSVIQKINEAPFKVIKKFYQLLFEEEGNNQCRRTVRRFVGFNFDNESEEYHNKVEFIKDAFTVPDLQAIANLLRIADTESKEDLAKNICSTLVNLESLREPEDDEDEEDDEGNDVPKEAERNEEIPEVRESEYVEEKKHKAGTFAVTFRDVEESIRKFNGKDGYPVEKWIQEFEELADLMCWNDLQRLIFAKKSLEDLAKILVNAERGITSWELLKKHLKKEFEDTSSEAEVHKLLMTRKKKETESIQEYTLIMRELASRANVSAETVIQYVIDGIQDDSNNKLTLYGAKTFDEFKEKMKLYNLIKSKTVQDHGRRYDSKAKNYHREQTKNEQGFRNKNVEVRCYNCGEKGHRSTDCPTKTKGLKCFACNQYGHKAAECKKSKEKNEPKIMKVVHKRSPVNMDIAIGNKLIEALLDTGSDVSLIRLNDFISLYSKTLIEDTIELSGLGNQKVKTLGSFETNIKMDDVNISAKLHVVPNETIKIPMIIGLDTLEKVTITINSRGIRLITKADPNEQNNLTEDEKQHEDETERKELQEDKTEDKEFEIFKIEYNEAELDLVHIDNPEARKEIQRLYENYDPKNNKTKTTPLQTKIILKDETPIYERPRRLSYLEKKEVEKQMEEWLAEGIIRPSHSEFTSPIVLVKKKNGTTRICQDYRKLNQRIVKDRYPLPLIEDQLDRLQGAKVFSTIDLKNGFFHVPVHEDSRKYTSFITPTGQYEYLKTPFGMCNSPAIFQRFINDIFKEHIKSGIALVYVDDVIILAKSEKEAIENLRQILKTAEEYGLEIQWSKCQFLQRSIEYLGHYIEEGRLKPSRIKTEAVSKFPIPKSAKQIKSFLGLTGYFRKFIKNYAIIAKPLSDLLKQGVSFEFEEKQKIAFETLKKKLAEEPVLEIYSVDAETELHTDACQDGLGAILLQKNEKGELHPVHYMSLKTTPTEKNYSSYELEVLAIVNALKKFRHYLLGIPFKIVTDCSAFTMTMKKKELVTRVARWALLLSEFDYRIEHRPGARMQHTDALSRNSTMIIKSSEPAIKNDFIETIKATQKKDDNLNIIIKLLQEGHEHENYFLKNNLLYKNYEGRELLAVAAQMQHEVIRQIHENNGHFGYKKTEDIILREFWIPKLRKKIENCIQNCVKCILYERKCGKAEGFLNPINKDELPLTTYHVDHLGPLPATKKGYKYLFVVIDGFSKFTWLYPTKTVTTEEVIQKLEIQRSSFGNPKRIIADKGTAFTSGPFREYCKEQHIDLVHITTGVARSNGQVERINKIIIPVIAKLASEDETKWFKHVEETQQAINNTYQRSINTSPFQLLFGVKMNRTEDIHLQELIQAAFLKSFEDNRDALRMSAKEQINKVQEENRKYYNKKRKPATRYEVGDLVAIRRTQFVNLGKFKSKYLGPYRVTAVNRRDRYHVERVGQGEGPKKTSTAADYMKPWSKHDQQTIDDFNEDDDGEFVGELQVRDGRVVGSDHRGKGEHEGTFEKTLRVRCERRADVSCDVVS